MYSGKIPVPPGGGGVDTIKTIVDMYVFIIHLMEKDRYKINL
jgi:hypothetical protein